MATVQSKIILRQGELANLPILDSGELGYASLNNEQRLFIGNPPISAVVIDDGGELVANAGVDLDLVYKFQILHGTNDITYTTVIDDNILKISPSAGVAVGDSVVIRYNTEILTYVPDHDDDITRDRFLAGSNGLGDSTDAATTPQDIVEFTIDNRYTTGEIKYAMRDEDTGAKRSGIISFNKADTEFTIEDNYSTTNELALPHEFSASYDSEGSLVINYTTTTTGTVKIAYITDFWNSKVV